MLLSKCDHNGKYTTFGKRKLCREDCESALQPHSVFKLMFQKQTTSILFVSYCRKQLLRCFFLLWGRFRITKSKMSFVYDRANFGKVAIADALRRTAKSLERGDRSEIRQWFNRPWMIHTRKIDR